MAHHVILTDASDDGKVAINFDHVVIYFAAPEGGTAIASVKPDTEYLFVKEKFEDIIAAIGATRVEFGP